MIHEITVPTESRDAFVPITATVCRLIDQAGVSNGRAIVFVPHTTAGVTINENADPDVVADLIAQLDRMVPRRQPFYRHAEGNTAAHLKASLVGSSVTVFVESGRLVLGTWQGIFLCEFDGPRQRRVLVKLVAD